MGHDHKASRTSQRSALAAIFYYRYHITMYDWKTTYPSLATVMEAGFSTIHTWVENLPPPQNDVERTVARRMRKRLQDLLPGELRQQAPEVADKYEALLNRINKLVG